MVAYLDKTRIYENTTCTFASGTTTISYDSNHDGWIVMTDISCESCIDENIIKERLRQQAIENTRSGWRDYAKPMKSFRLDNKPKYIRARTCCT
jgi:hypothetical protein